MMLEGKVAVVSGIGPGLGRSWALALAREGCDIALAARREANLKPVAAEIEALGRRAVWRPTDVSDAEACRALVDLALEKLGRIDIVVNSAAGNASTLFEDGDLDGWRSAMDVTFFGSLQLTHAALPALIESGDGRVINIGTAATRAIEPTQGGYAASNAALLTATKTLAKELGAKGIRVNAINPGYTLGPSIRYYFKSLAKEHGGAPEDYESEVAAGNALRYIPSPDEVAGSLVFLASDLSRPVTGHVIECNAGHWIG